MAGIKTFHKTGERFRDEGEYANAGPPIGPGFPSPSTLPLVPSIAYSSDENDNKFYTTPSPLTQEHLYQRKPLDCGSVKILSNNISHLAYQKCRTLAVLNGPGSIGYTKSDLDVTDPVDGSDYVLTPYPSALNPNSQFDGYRRDAFREIGWSYLSSRRLGPFFAITDRKFQYAENTIYTTPLQNNASNIRNMVLCITGYKAKIPSGTGVPADGVLRFHVCVTTDGSPPSNPNAGIIPLNGDSRAFVEATLGSTSAPGALPVPANTNVVQRSQDLQGSQSILVPLNSTSAGDDLFYGAYKVFIPIDCIGNITTTNATYASIGVAEYYVHVGWYSGSATNTVTCISLHEVRDPGSYIAS